MAPNSPAESKQTLRRLMRRRRMNLPIHDQSLSGLALARRLSSLPTLRPGGLLLGTLPHLGEIDARPFLQFWLESALPLALPRVAESTGELEIRAVNHLDQTLMGFRGIPEPDPDSTRVVSPHLVTFLLVPGLAFDPRGNRIGQGGGHYDRLLNLVEGSAVRIGIAHDFQIFPLIPHPEAHDQPMDFVVSPTRVIQCPRRRARLAPS